MELKKHNRLHKPPTLKCPHCNVMMRWEHSMEDHIRTHTGEKPYEWVVKCTVQIRCMVHGLTIYPITFFISDPKWDHTRTEYISDLTIYIRSALYSIINAHASYHLHSYFHPQVLLLQSLQRKVFVPAQLPQEVPPPARVGGCKSPETGKESGKR